MAKISLSIPDELKDQLDTYAYETGFNRSQAVAHILTAYFQGQVIPSPSTQDLQSQIQSLQNYLATLHDLNPDFPRPPWVEAPEGLVSFIGRD